MSLFNCRFVDGRAESAPALRRDPATVNIAHDSSTLPHLHLPEDIAELFEEAIPDPARPGETDLTPAEELQDPVPTIIARREARQKLNARVPLQGTTTSTTTSTTTTTTEATKKVSRAPRRSEPLGDHESWRPLAVAGAQSAKKVSRAPRRSEPKPLNQSSRPSAVARALSASRTRSLLQSDSPCNIVGVDICIEQTRAPLQGATTHIKSNSCVDCVDRRNTRRVLHSEGQGIPVSLEPRKKSLRPFTPVGALGASFVFVTTALPVIVPKFCQPRLEPSSTLSVRALGACLPVAVLDQSVVTSFVFSEE